MINVRHNRFVPVVIAAGLVLFPVLLSLLQTAPAAAEPASTTVFSVVEQVVIVSAAFVLKPLYQILSLIIVVILWKRTEPDLAALRRAVLAFFIGENACAANYLFFGERSVFMEFIHTYGMVVCFGLVTYAMLEAFDSRVFHFSQKDKKCVLLPQCGRCYKYCDSRCNLRLLFVSVIPATAAIAAIPLTATLGSHFFIGKVFGSLSVFGQPVVYQVLETRLYPAASLLFFMMSFTLLLVLKEDGFEPSKVFYAMGAGPLGFGLLRFFFYWGYREKPLWADAWEEITEFLFIAVIYWIVLRIRAVSRQRPILGKNDPV